MEENASYLRANYDKLCRFCLKRTRNRENFDKLMANSAECQKFYKLLGFDLTASDNLPNVICANCYKMVHDCFLFHQTFLKSYSTLNALNINRTSYKIELVAKVEQKEAEFSSFDIYPSIDEVYPISNMEVTYEKHDADAKAVEVDQQNSCKTKINKRLTRACNLCGKVVRNLQAHLLWHKQEKKSFACTQCPKAFSDRTYLKKHQKQHEQNPLYGKYSDVENYRIKGRQHRQCPVCGKIVKNLGEHLIVHSLKSFQCHHCEKLFGIKRQMVTHMRIHLNIRNYTCQICTRSFTHSSTLQKHMKTHRDKIQCPVTGCPRLFKTEKLLQIHFRTHTLNSDYTCEICKRVFATDPALISHSRIHGKDWKAPKQKRKQNKVILLTVDESQSLSLAPPIKNVC